MPDHDRELLRRYACTGAEEAFRDLVTRQVNLVYSAALRSVGGDAALAEDVTQTVFSGLARKAASLPEETIVAGWLYQAARYEAAKTVRAEQRRRNREAAAMEVQMNQPEPEPDWVQIRPLLDAAMDELPEADRNAVVLRFFHRRNLQDVGAALGLSDEAARKRVSRALERLRTFLSRRGITTSTGALAATISTHAIGAAPAGLASTIVAGSLAVGASATTPFALKFLSSIAMTKTQTAVLTVALSAGIATPLVIHQRNEAQRLRVELDALRVQLAELSAPTSPAAPVEPARTADQPTPSERTELLRLRGEVARLRGQPVNPPKPPPPVARQVLRARGRFQPTAPLSTQPGYIPAAQYQFTGFATPQDALQSFLWAAENPASGKLLATLALPEELRRQLPEDGQQVAVGLGLPPAEIPEGQPPGEDVVEKASPGEALGQSTGFRIASESDIEPGMKQIEVERELPDGTVVSETHMVRKIGDEWKVEPGTGLQISFSGDGKQVQFNQVPLTTDDGSQKVSQTFDIRGVNTPAQPPNP